MALTFVEQYNANRPVSLSENGQMNAVRVFKVVTTNNVQAVREDFDTQAGLRIHPSYPNLQFAGASFYPSETGAAVAVEVQYSTNPGSRFVAPPKDDEKYFSWDFGYKELTVDIPIALRVPVVVEVAGVREVRRAWSFKMQKVSERRSLAMLTLRIKRPTDDVYFAEFQRAVDQINTLHDLSGTIARFAGVDAKEVDGKKLDLKYTWEIDKGTPIPENFTNTEGEAELMIPADAQDGFIRNPYSVIVVIPTTDPVANRPTASSLYPYPNTPASLIAWRNLLGIERVP